MQRTQKGDGKKARKAEIRHPRVGAQMVCSAAARLGPAYAAETGNLYRCSLRSPLGSTLFLLEDHEYKRFMG